VRVVVVVVAPAAARFIKGRELLFFGEEREENIK
jgi:hypothetical protein